MIILRQLGQRLFSRAQSPPRSVVTSGYALLDSSRKIEEERMPAYDRQLYLPVHLGDVHASRYQVLSKLGYGANSTVWFCRDLQKHRYVALKIYIRGSSSEREVDILSRLSAIKSTHPGSHVVRKMIDDFKIDGPEGKHQCIVHDPLLTTLLHFQATFSPPQLNENLVRGAIEQLLLALDFLHTEAHVVHTDIQAKNIIIGANDPSIFDEWDKEEQEKPSPRKFVGENAIYQSRRLDRQRDIKRFGMPILSDFGEARFGDTHEGLIQPDIYRAPEVILGMSWTSKVDIWNVGVLIWHLLTGGYVFEANGPDGSYSVAQHLGEMVVLLGQPPIHFLQNSAKSMEYWDDKGAWKGVVNLPPGSREDFEASMDGEGKELFFKFLWKMLQWDPERRSSARELLIDPWLNPTSS